MAADGTGKMFCLAGVGGRVEPIMQMTQSASRIMAIDGCPMDCTKNCLEQTGFTELQHLRATDMGMEKGKTPVTDEAIGKVAQQAATMTA